MGIREKLNDNPAYTTGGTIAIIVIALAFIIWQLLPNRPSIPTKSYYTTDNGTTYFSDSIKKIPPYEHDGKQAVRCYVFQCSKGGKFVGYLEEYTPAAKKELEAAAANPKRQQMPGMDMAAMTGMLVKKPGTGQWVSQQNGRYYESVVDVKCPNGGADPQIVSP